MTWATRCPLFDASIAGGQYLKTNTANTKIQGISSLIPNSYSADPSSLSLTAYGEGFAWYNSTDNVARYWNGLGKIDFGGPVKTPQMYGAVADGATNDATAIQAAITAAMVSGGMVFFPEGTYMIKTAITVTNGGTKGFSMIGAGQHATILVTPATGSSGALTTGSLITVTCTGYATTISDMTITADTGGNTNIDGLTITASNGVTVDKLWLSSFHENLKVTANSSNNRITRIESEYGTIGVTVSASDMNTFNDIHTYRNSSAGVYITGTPTLDIAGTSQGNVFNNLSLFEDGYGGDGAGAAFYNESPVPYAITNITAGGYGSSTFPYTGIYNNTGHTFGTISNPIITMASRYGIRHIAGDLLVNGGRIEKVGYYDQSTPWATYGVYAGAGATTLFMTGTKINSEGIGIKSLASNTMLNSLYFENCSNGGSTGSVNATTGVSAIYLDPQATTTQAKLIGNHFYNADGTGKTLLTIGNTATPAAGNLKFIGNEITLSSFATKLTTSLANAVLIGYDWYGNTGWMLTENSGTSTIANAATTATVTHGLGLTPLAQHIYVIGTEKPAHAVGTIWLSDIGAETFQVNVENDPGATGWDFSWRASIR